MYSNHLGDVFRIYSFERVTIYKQEDLTRFSETGII